MTNNPFSPSRVVPPERFIGRTAILNNIKSYLAQSISIVIVGEVKVGKTSLLKYLLHTLQKYTPANYFPIYLSLDTCDTQQAFFQKLIEDILPHIPTIPGKEHELRQMQQRVDDGTALTMKDMRTVVAWANASRLHCVLLLDEFQDLFKHPDVFNEFFLGNLRSLYQDGQLILVLAARHKLQQISGFNAYFANGIAQIMLDKMFPSEAEQLLRQYPFSDDEIRIAMNVGECHPFRLQWAGHSLYCWRTQPDTTFYDATGKLINSSLLAQKLKKEVNQRFQDMKESSKTPKPRWDFITRTFDTIGLFIKSTSDLIQDWQGRASVVSLFVLLIIAILGLYFDQITFDQFLSYYGGLVRSVFP